MGAAARKQDVCCGGKPDGGQVLLSHPAAKYCVEIVSVPLLKALEEGY